MNIAFLTLGCKVNQAETEELVRATSDEGYQVVDPSRKADVFVVNTCTVTATADAKTRQLLRRLHRRNPSALIVATGCYAERNPQELHAIEGVDLLVPRKESHNMLSVLPRWLGTPQPTRSKTQLPLRTRALIKVQDGCSLGCTYCIVPKVRGPGQCRPIEEILVEVARRLDEGFHEVVLTGIHIGSYNHRPDGLSQLVNQILRQTKLSRLRLTSLHPCDISHRLLSEFGDYRLCPHLHIPLQSGSNKVLRAMGRHYSAEDFRLAVTAVMNAILEVSVTTDVIVGFPGETDQDFEQTLSLCQQLPFSWIHAFPFSARPGTPAATLPGVEESVKAKRMKRLISLANEKQAQFQRTFLGRNMPVLWEREAKTGVWTGLTPNYMRVHCKSQENLKGRITDTKLEQRMDWALWGRLA